MAQEDFVSVQNMKNYLVFRKKDNYGDIVRIQKAARIMITQSLPGKYCIAYSHNPEMERYKEVNIAKKGKIPKTCLTPLHQYRLPINVAKLQDLRNLCQFIPAEY